MKILKLKATNLMLFKSIEINPQHINLAKGINFDSPKDSSNGSGKSTLFKIALLFVLYGESCGKKLNKLIRDGEKECSLEIELEHRGQQFRIIRAIPNSLQIFVDGVDKEFNTPTIAQNYLNSIFGDYKFFQKYCLIDDRGIDLLDSLDDVRSVISFKKELMQFITDEFEPIRQSLLDDKNNRELYNIDKKLYHFYLSTKRQTILENGLRELQEESVNIRKTIDEQNKVINDLKAETSSKEKEIYYKQNEIKKAKEGICPILKTKCEKISKSLNEKDNQINSKVLEEIKQLNQEIEQIKSKGKEEESCMGYYDGLHNNIRFKIEKVKECLMKLKEAQKFSIYKYTKADVQLYTDTIKTLDEFSGFYISEWMNNLSFIINDLLKSVNLSIELTDGKEFIKMRDGEKEWTWVDLSSGQQKLLSAVFKMGILLQKGESDKIIIMDDGLWGIDKINFINLIEICQTLPMQFFIIFQDYPPVENVNDYIIERKNDESMVK